MLLLEINKFFSSQKCRRYADITVRIMWEYSRVSGAFLTDRLILGQHPPLSGNRQKTIENLSIAVNLSKSLVNQNNIYGSGFIELRLWMNFPVSLISCHHSTMFIHCCLKSILVIPENWNMPRILTRRLFGEHDNTLLLEKPTHPVNQTAFEENSDFARKLSFWLYQNS